MAKVLVGIAVVLTWTTGWAQTPPVDPSILPYGDWREKLPKQSDSAVSVRLDRATIDDELKPLRDPDAGGWPVSP
jgi:hypothetical protein